MLRLPRRVLFAVEAVVDIAYNTADAPVRSADISSRQGIPPRYLEPVLQQLVRADILSGVRGPRGGYRLARERRRIAVGDIVRVALASSEDAEPGDGSEGSALARAVVHPLWHELEADVMTRLDALSVEDLCRRAAETGIPSAAAPKLDFSI